MTKSASWEREICSLGGKLAGAVVIGIFSRGLAGEQRGGVGREVGEKDNFWHRVQRLTQIKSR